MNKIFHILIILLLSLNINVFADQGTKSTSVITPTATNSIQWGVNIHDGGSNPQNIANKLADRNLKFVRMDLWGQDPGYLANFILTAKIMLSKNIKIQVVVNSVFTNGQPRSQDYNADLAEVEQSVYNQIKPGIVSTKDLVSEYELHNEIPLYPDMNLAGTTGQNASDYDTPACRLQAAALRGISKAIDDVRKMYNLPIRIILGTVDRRFGFLTYMQQKGVLFDIVGYHTYPYEQYAPLDQDPWFGVGGPLGQLAAFNKPIHINEFNCGEIYSNYENKAMQPVTETGYRGIYKHLNEIVNQNVAKVEAVYFYEVYDEPLKGIPENSFGLYYDSNMEKPKISLLLAAAYAGGLLSPAEQDSLTTRNFIFNTNVTTEKFYLLPSSQWLSNSSTFGAIFKNGAMEVKVPFTLNNTTGMYELTIPTGTWMQICMKRYSSDGTGDWGGFSNYDAVQLKQVNNFISYDKSFNCITIKGWTDGTDPSQYIVSTYPASTQIKSTDGGTEINIFPNPVKSSIKIESSVAFNSIQIYNSMGLKLISKKSDWKNNTNLNLISLPSGMYIIEINTEASNIVKTILKL